MSNVNRVVDRFLNRFASLPPAKVDQRTKTTVIRAMKSKGLDGNGRFEKPERGYSAALDVLGDFGIEMDEVVNSFLFKPDSNFLTIRIAFSNKADPFSPTSIVNSRLAISYTKLAENKYEVLAYLT